MAAADRYSIFKIHRLLTWGSICGTFSRGVTVGVLLSSVKRSVMLFMETIHCEWGVGFTFREFWYHKKVLTGFLQHSL